MSTDLANVLVYQNQPISHWLAALHSDDAGQREQAATLCSGMSVLIRSTVPQLIQLLKDPDPGVRLQAVSTLGTLGHQSHTLVPEVRGVLQQTAFADTDEAVRNAAVQAVVQIGPQVRSQLPALIDSLQDELPVVRFNAATALGEMGKEARPAVPNLIRAHLHDADAGVRVAATVALWKIEHRDTQVLPSLLKALQNEDEFVCWMAADCLGDIGPAAKEAIPILKAALTRKFKVSLIQKGVALALQRVQGS